MLTEQQEQYIEQQVQIRVLSSELKSIQKNFDDRFLSFEKLIEMRFSSMDSKINWFFGVNITCIFVSIFLKVIGVF